MDCTSPIFPESEHDIQSNSDSSSLSPSIKVPCFLSISELRKRREAIKDFPEVPARRQPSDEEECRVEQLVHRITTEKRRRKGRCELPRSLFCTRFTGPLARPYFDPSYVPEPHNPDIALELATDEEEWEAQQAFRDKKRAEKRQLREKVIGWQASIGDLATSRGLSVQSVEQALLDMEPGTPVAVDVGNVTKIAPEVKAPEPIRTVDQSHHNKVSCPVQVSTTETNQSLDPANYARLGTYGACAGSPDTLNTPTRSSTTFWCSRGYRRPFSAIRATPSNYHTCSPTPLNSKLPNRSTY